MPSLSFVSEKTANGRTYQAWRDSSNPTEVIVIDLTDNSSVKYTGSFAEFWRGLK